MCTACQTGYQEIRNWFNNAGVRTEITSTITNFLQRYALLCSPSPLVRFQRFLGNPSPFSKRTNFLNDPFHSLLQSKIKQKISSVGTSYHKISDDDKNHDDGNSEPCDN